MSICIKDQIQNMNLVIGCTVGCAYCYARNNVKRWHVNGKLYLSHLGKKGNEYLSHPTKPL